MFNYILAQRKRYTGSIKMSGYELERNHSKAMEIIGFVSEDNVFFENRTESRMLIYWDLCMMILMWNCLMNV